MLPHSLERYRGHQKNKNKLKIKQNPNSLHAPLCIFHYTTGWCFSVFSLGDTRLVVCYIFMFATTKPTSPIVIHLKFELWVFWQTFYFIYI